ncbi:MAG: hypothetical protein WBL28_00715 [Methylotenera sp.]
MSRHSERNEESSSYRVLSGIALRPSFRARHGIQWLWTKPLSRGGRVTFSCVAKKIIQKEGYPAAASSFGLSAASGAAAELATLKQSSPPTICRSSLRRGKGDKHSADCAGT